MNKVLTGSTMAPDLVSGTQELHLELLAGHKWKRDCPAMILKFSDGEPLTEDFIHSFKKANGLAIGVPKDRKLSAKIYGDILLVLGSTEIIDTPLLNGVIQRRITTREYRITWYR